jgi:hypothetical protein
MILTVNMKDGTKYATQVEADSLEEVETMISGKKTLKLIWPDAFALVNVDEISSLTAGIARPKPVDEAEESSIKIAK